MPWCTPELSEADGLAWLARYRADQAVQQAHEFGVIDAGTGALLGYWVRQSAQSQGVARNRLQIYGRAVDASMLSLIP